MDYKISIIIPCYNVEKYISRCIKSLINQTLGIEYLQLIFVNDASTDSTLKIISEYEKKYPENICIINLEKNMGQGYARNAALNYAYANYIGYVDSDDWVELNMFEKLFDKMTKYNCDVVMCKSDRPRSEDEAKREITGEDMGLELNNINDRKSFLAFSRFDVVAWNKLIRKQFLIDNKIFFAEKFKFEDNYWAMLLFLYVKRIYILEECLYHWFYNPNSTVTGRNFDLDRAQVQLLLMEECKKRGLLEDYSDELEYNFYEKFFVETIFFLFKDDYITVDLLNELKNIVFKWTNLKNNSYYKYDKAIARLGCEKEIRKLLEQDITTTLINEVAKNLTNKK